MDNVFVFEGKTSTEAIEKGLKELKVSKNKVDIKILEQEDKRSFFNILTPRVVKVEMRLKETHEEKVKDIKKVAKEEKLSEEDAKKSIEVSKKFLDEFLDKLPENNLNYEIKEENNGIKINIEGENIGYLIGYRGEVLNSIQTIISNLVAKNCENKVRILLNIDGYREKREKELENLANKIANTVIKTRKDITLEPMPAYERKIIHTKLQDNSKIKTHSVGEEPYRKVVVSLNK